MDANAGGEGGGGGSVSGVRCDAVGTAAAFFLSLSLSLTRKPNGGQDTDADRRHQPQEVRRRHKPLSELGQHVPDHNGVLRREVGHEDVQKAVPHAVVVD